MAAGFLLAVLKSITVPSVVMTSAIAWTSTPAIAPHRVTSTAAGEISGATWLSQRSSMAWAVASRARVSICFNEWTEEPLPRFLTFNEWTSLEDFPVR